MTDLSAITLNDHLLLGRSPQHPELKVVRCGRPGPGGAYHLYGIEGIDYDKRPDRTEFESAQSCAGLIPFQYGAVGTEHNGCTEQALLAILIDRMRYFQHGPFSCLENAVALTKLEEALHWLHHRTADRLRREVEGQNLA